RPFLVREHFDGVSLAEHVAAHGPFSPEDWLEVAWPIGRALQALHNRGALHRCLHPGCVLLSRRKTRDGAKRWQVKLLDAGLALRRALVHAASASAEARGQTNLGRSAALIVPYSPIEVVGRPKGQVWVGPHSDVYSFGRLCAFGLTGKPDPDAGDLLLLDEGWKSLLADCTAWAQAGRPAHLGPVLDRISHLNGAGDLVGQIERDLNDLTTAEHSAALEADPTSLTALIHRAQAHAENANPTAAIADFTEAIRLQPDDALLYGRRGEVQARAGHTTEAIADFTE